MCVGLSLADRRAVPGGPGSGSRDGVLARRLGSSFWNPAQHVSFLLFAARWLLTSAQLFVSSLLAHTRIVHKPFASLCSFCKCCEVFKTQASASFWGVSPYTCSLGSTWLAQFGVTSSVSEFFFLVARGVMAVALNRFAVHAMKTSPGGVVEALGIRNSVQ